MSSIEEFYFDHENVLVFTNLDDIGEPYTCDDWGNRGTQFGASPLITDDGPSLDLWGKFNTGGYFPSVIFIDHTMTVHYKQSGGPSLALTQTIINQMLNNLYNSLLISANFTHDFNNDIDGDGLINPGDSFDLVITVFNKSYDENNTALNVNIELLSDEGIIITSQDLGNIGDINAQDSFQIEANIAISDDIEIKDYLLNLVVSITDLDGDEIIKEFQTDFTVTLNQYGFPTDVLGELISSAAIVDLDNDGEDEIISSDKGGFVHVFEMDGTEWVNLTYPYETGDQNWGSPAVGNLDGDGFDDVVISSKNGNIYIFDHTGLKSIFNSSGGDGYVTATPSLGDVDGDGLDEIIFGQYNTPKYLYAINGDGSNVSGFPVSLDEKVQRGVALADFNGNGKMDIVVGTDDEFIHLIHDDGTIAWSYETGGDIRVAPTVLELTTGEKIILAGSNDDNFYALNSDGTVRFMVETDDKIATEASVVDIDGIGPVIFFASGDYVYAVESDGTAFSDWPINIGEEVISSITFASIEPYSWPLVMFGDDSGKVHVYTMSGESYDNFPIVYSFPFKGSPTILDTDGDGDLEFILGSTQTLTNIDIKENGNITGLWSTHRSDMTRSGYYLSSVDVLSTGDNIENYQFSILNAYPNPFNPSVTIDYVMNESKFVEISIVNLQGQVIDVFESSFKNKGINSIVWNPINISSGIYFINISSGNQIETQKLMFMK